MTSPPKELRLTPDRPLSCCDIDYVAIRQFGVLTMRKRKDMWEG